MIARIIGKLLFFGVCLVLLAHYITILPEPISFKERVTKAQEYANIHNMSSHYALFIDYSIPSGTPRLFVWDYNKDAIVEKLHVMHGSGRNSTDETPVFSNEIDSNCSSIGRFKITREHGTRLKQSYRLIGMDETNSRALQRGILIHNSKWVDKYLCEDYIPLNEIHCKGCVTISSEGMNYIENLILSENKPILLYSYYDPN